MPDGITGDIDAHGDLNIFSELDWSNVQLVVHKGHVEIQGLTLNSLLNGVFILYGYKTVNQNDLPGGNHCWEEVVSAAFTTIKHLCTIEELLSRITKIFDVLVDHKLDVSNAAFGAIAFLKHLVSHFDTFLSDSEMTNIKLTVNYYNDLFTVQSITHGFLDDFSSTWETGIELCVAHYQELRSVLFEANLKRSSFTSGLIFPSSAAAALRAGNFTRTDMEILRFRPTVNPYLEPIVGGWDGEEDYGELLVDNQSKDTVKEAIKEQLELAPLKLELFGGNMLLDCSSSDMSDPTPALAPEEETSEVPESFVPFPVSRVQKGFSLLKGVDAIADEIFTFDPLELARQWTLVDHFMFSTLPLHSLLLAQSAGNFSGDALYSLPRHAQMRVAQAGQRGSVRAIIDRFNAASLWVTRSVLQPNGTSHSTFTERADALTYFVQLAAHLEMLRNYNGLMAVLTALQQGCVSRLKRTWELVPKGERDKLMNLQTLMAGNKNYLNYRQEVSKVLASDEICNPRSLLNLKNASTKRAPREEPAWKRDLHTTYHPSTPYKPVTTVENASPGSPLVPHIGAHLAELTAIGEGNGDFLSASPHLLNIRKCVLYSQTLLTLLEMQRRRYHVAPVRAVAAALNLKIKQNLQLSASSATQQSKLLYALSEELEGSHNIETRLPMIPRNCDLSPSRAASMSSIGGEGMKASLLAKRDVPRKTVSFHNIPEEEEESSENTSIDSKGDNQGGKTKRKGGLAKLTRALTLGAKNIFKRTPTMKERAESVEDSEKDSEEGSVGKGENKEVQGEEGVEQGKGSEEGSEESEESEQPKKKSKSPWKFIKAFSKSLR